MTKSEELFKKSEKLMPGGVNSPVRAFRAVGRTPLFISRGEGDKIYDEDGNEYIDYVCSWGPLILGHARAEVISAVRSAAERGLSFGAPTGAEYELASLISECVPSMQMLRLVSSGTEAVMSAVRVARGFTGRDKIVKFVGCYHGHSDGLLCRAGSGLLTDSLPDSLGVPEGYVENTLLAEYNDEESVEKLFSARGDEIACVIVEPVAANMGVIPPKEGFLQFLRSITEKYGALLIFDEVITGFRLALGGAQSLYGVNPDLTTFGKIVGGGMPLACYGGRADVMRVVAPIGGVYQAGTLSGNPVSVAAGIATLKILKENPEIYTRIDKSGERLERAYKKIGVTVNRVGSLISPFMTKSPVTDFCSAKKSDVSEFSRYFAYMLENGIYVAPSQFEAMFVSAAHSEADTERTVRAIENYSVRL